MTGLQSSQTLLVVYVLVFVGVLVAFEGLRQVLSRGETAREARNRRMRMIARGATTEDVIEQLMRPGSTRTGLARRLPDLRVMLRQAGLTIPPWLFLLGAVVLGAGAAVAAQMVLPPMAAAPVGVLAGLIVPLMVLKGLAQQRLEKLVQQMPDALDLMARGLKVGNPLNVTVRSVATDMPDPIGSEFGLITDQVSYGDDIATAFDDFALRTGLEDARYLAVTIGIQHGTGGNLARILQVLSKVIRDRAMMRKKIHAISAEGRLSALILSLLPFGIFAMIMGTTPSFYADVWNDPLFLPFAGTAVGLVVLQGLILRRLVSFKF